jgi:oleate hydratase
MGNYQKNHPRKPSGIENKKAYLVGGGIGSLAAAYYLITDGHMKGENITILEMKDIAGGALDGAGNAEEGYVIRGGREMEAHYECTWDMFSQIPSIKNPELSVLDEFRVINQFDPNESVCRVLHNQGERADSSTLGLSEKHVKQISKLFLATEKDLGRLTVEQFFDPSFLETNLWLFWRSMFAFENWHSVVEMKRYVQRFTHLLPGMNKLKGILFSEYNQYDSFVLPLLNWMEKHKVRIQYNTTVTDLDIELNGTKKVVTGIHCLRNGKQEHITTTCNDLVFITNGSMTENSSIGSMNKAPELIREPGAVWNLWDNIAKKDASFGNPKVFHGDIDKTKWESFTMTFKNSKMVDVLKNLTGNDPYSGKSATGSVVTIKDSNWLMSFTSSRQPHFVNQPDDVIVLWAYGLFPDNHGNFIDKKMSDCSGEELLRELLYHLGVEKSLMDEVVDSAIVIPVMMPYITSQFMPRVKGDRPDVVPEGSVNLAFLGQFAEIADDCVFTVEYSIRSAIIGVYTLLALDKEVPAIYDSKSNIQVLANAAKTLYSGRPLPAEHIVKKLISNTTLEGLI